MAKFTVTRKHEIHTGHRVYGHDGKCKHLHGHSYVIYFHCQSIGLDHMGMVVDFGIIKATLCKWLDDNYDHRMLIWEKDELSHILPQLDPSVVIVPYNPTAENIAYHLLTDVAPKLLSGTCIYLNQVTVEETSKCQASYSVDDTQHMLPY